MFEETIESEIIKQPDELLLSYVGNANDYFKLFYTNVALSILTLGMYYPWARVNNRKFFYNNTLLNGSAFQFNGTGKEMYKGFLLMIFAGLVFFKGQVVLAFFDIEWFSYLLPVIYLGIFILLPYAVFGNMRYIAGRTTWRGIQFGFYGNLKEFYIFCIKGFLLTIVSCGIYGFWFISDINKYRLENIFIGDLKIKFKASGGDLFVTYFVLFLISLLAASPFILIIGFYFDFVTAIKYANIVIVLFSPIIYTKLMLDYFINFTSFYHHDGVSIMRLNGSVATFYRDLAKPIVLTIVTCGIYAPILISEAYKLIISNIQFSGRLFLSEINQTQMVNNEVTGEIIADLFNIEGF